MASGFVEARAGTSRAKQAIVDDLDLTQFYQGMANGGAGRTFKPGGKLDDQFIFSAGAKRSTVAAGIVSELSDRSVTVGAARRPTSLRTIQSLT